MSRRNLNQWKRGRQVNLFFDLLAAVVFWVVHTPNLNVCITHEKVGKVSRCEQARFVNMSNAALRQPVANPLFVVGLYAVAIITNVLNSIPTLRANNNAVLSAEALNTVGRHSIERRYPSERHALNFIHAVQRFSVWQIRHTLPLCGPRERWLNIQPDQPFTDSGMGDAKPSANVRLTLVRNVYQPIKRFAAGGLLAAKLQAFAEKASGYLVDAQPRANICTINFIERGYLLLRHPLSQIQVFEDCF